MKHARLVAIVLALLVPSVIAQPANDAGSGLDAPASENDIFMIPSGSFSGELRKDDGDWYTTFDGAGSLACVTLAATSEIAAQTKLVVRDGDARREMRTSIGPGVEARLAHTANTLKDARLGFENPLDAGPDRGFYSFAVKTVTPNDFSTDGNTGRDAPGGASGAPAIAPGCLAGRVGLMDSADTYAFAAAKGDVAVLSFAAPSGTDVRLELVDVNGALLASVLGGQRTLVSLPQSGTYTMTASTTSAASTVPYMLGMTLGPPTQGCRPACLSS